MYDVFSTSRYLKLATKAKKFRSERNSLKNKVCRAPRYILCVTAESKLEEPLKFTRYYSDEESAWKDIDKMRNVILSEDGVTVAPCSFGMWKMTERIGLGTSFNIDRFWFSLREIPETTPSYSTNDDMGDFFMIAETRDITKKIVRDIRKVLSEN